MSRLRPLFSCLFSATLIGLIVMAGCTNQSKTEDKKKSAEEHSHPDKGPHDGILVEWGEEEYHAEFLRDKDAKKITVYVLDGEAKEMLPIEATEIDLNISSESPLLQLKLKAAPQKSDPEGKSSRFELVHPKFDTASKMHGEVGARIDGKRYDGQFDEANPGHAH